MHMFEQISQLAAICLLVFTKCDGLECSIDSGEPGLPLCVITFEEYNSQPQWSICYSNEEVELASGGQHKCDQEDESFCRYPCMLLSHGMSDGDVEADCTCTPGSNSTSNTAFISAECFNPSGDGCEFYERCLEKRHPCETSDDSYSIEYAYKFCSRYQDNYELFSDAGKVWVDGVRTCLQKKLVPFLPPWVETTCSDIKDFAFSSHVGCYLKPGDDDDVGICHLSYSDFAVVVYTIFPALLSDFQETVNGFYQTIVKNCPEKIFIPGCFLKPQCGKIVIEMKFFRLIQRQYTRIPDLNKVLAGVSSRYDWLTTGIEFAVLNSSIVTENEEELLYVKVLLYDNTLDKSDFSLPLVDLSESVSALLDKVAKNQVYSLAGEFGTLQATSARVCRDESCSESTQSAHVQPNLALKQKLGVLCGNQYMQKFHTNVCGYSVK